MNIRCGSSVLALVALLAACDQDTPTQAAGPEPIVERTYCSLDGMRLADYPGPKAQIRYAQGRPDFFCDTVEMFAVALGAEQQRRMTALYVQDMKQADWQHPGDRWIDARRAAYVSGSDQRGSMGATLVPFSDDADAQAFARKHGGKVLHFADVTPDMVALDGGALHDTAM
jgi:copper chaperone NosL